MGRGQEEIIECQSGHHDSEQALPEAAEPGAEYDGAEENRCEGLGMPEMPQYPRVDDR